MCKIKNTIFAGTRAQKQSLPGKFAAFLLIFLLSLQLSTGSLSALDDYRTWGQGTSNGFNDGVSYPGWCLANAYTKVLIQSGAYSEAFTPDDFDAAMTAHLGYRAVNNWNGYCNFREDAVQAISKGKISSAYRVGVDWGSDVDAMIMEQVRLGNQVIVKLSGHYIAIDVLSSYLHGEPWVMDSLNTLLSKDPDGAFRRSKSNVPLSEAQAILRGSSIYALIIFETEEPLFENKREAVDARLAELLGEEAVLSQ